MPDPKIKSKDLSYEASLPPFLQRLHAQKAGRAGDEDRHEYQIARPKRAKNADEDDGPTVVDESGEIVGKEEMEKMSGDVGSAKIDVGDDLTAAEVAVEDVGEERKGSERKVTDGLVNAAKKRKAVKVVGEEEEVLAGEPRGEGKQTEKPAKKIAKKKAKPIKLAFEDDAAEGT